MANEDTVYLKFKGSYTDLDEEACKYEFKLHTVDKEICVDPKDFKLRCDAEVTYDEGYYPTYIGHDKVIIQYL